jgi:geranylgeranyl diphosphate synthase type II
MSVHQKETRRRSGERDASRPEPVPAVSEAWTRWFGEQRQIVDRAVSDHVNGLKTVRKLSGRLLEAVEYSLCQPGKRVRPILVLECCRVCGGDDAVATPAALAVECVHTFSLIHDDLPAMDDDDLRRGRPTNHRVFGEALAVLAGDWLVPHAFELLAANPVSPAIVPELVRTLAGATQAMVVGQATDMAGEQKPADADLVEAIHLHKTARLIEACCRLGGLAGGGGQQIEALGIYGRHLGLAFQIVDDLLDQTGSTAALGKQAGKDARVQKQTYPAAFGIEASRRRAREHVDAAAGVLGAFGPRAEKLCGLASFVIQRQR